MTIWYQFLICMAHIMDNLTQPKTLTIRLLIKLINIIFIIDFFNLIILIH